jgi:hypothetical protein
MHDCRGCPLVAVDLRIDCSWVNSACASTSIMAICGMLFYAARI